MKSLPALPYLSLWLLGLVALFNCSCAGPGLPQAVVPSEPKGWWHGEGVSGRPRIVIDLTEQQIHYFKGGQLVGESPISSGSEGHSTMTGTYRIIEKDVDHRSSLYGAYCDKDRQIVVPDVDCTKDERPKGTQFIGASMPFFMRIFGGVGMHEGYLPGYPASHGCIRLPREMAEAFYFATPVGTPVEIKGNAALAENRSTPAQIAPPPTAKPKKAEAPQKTQVAAAPAASKPANKSKEPFFRLRWGGARATPKPAPVPFGTTLYLE